MEQKAVGSKGMTGKLKLVLVYLLFVFINIFVNRLVRYAGLPLYVDNIGTMLGAVLGGYLPGIFVGYFTNLLNSTADVTNLYYAGVSVLIAITASFFAKRGFYDKFWKALLTIPFLAFFGGVVGSVLTWFIYGSGTGFVKQLLTDFGLDLIDKAITVVAAFLIMKALPKNVSGLLKLTDWRQKPMTKEEFGAARRVDVRGLTLQKKLTLIISCVMIVGVFATTAISFFLYKNFATEQYKNIGKTIAKTVAVTVDGDRVKNYLEEGEAAGGYSETKQKLYEIRDSAPYVQYVYVYQIREDGCHVIFDLDTDEVEGSKTGEVIPFDESFRELLPDLLAGRDIEPIITNETFGWLLTDYEPVYDSEGNCVCYACADVSMADVRSSGIAFLAKVLSLFIGFFILILVLCMWLADYHMTYPIDAMAFAAGEFARNGEEGLDASLEELKSLDISTADEIENLYHVLVKSLSATVGYLEDAKAKGEQIAEMQNGLIYILADLVESRDKCTGDHVRKTASYVRLILELLKEDHVYEDQITDSYVKDVCNSAPLHDIGKIEVPDAILNKPAKLDDREYFEMKKHTTAGGKIIENAKKLTGDAGYLDEALNLAAYHHEKWDGTGYPTGLKGEEIPLSARIMAVSDVFDALLSKRSYKKPFTFEQAMKIIEDGKGTHFDPKIVQVFVDHADRVRELAEENERMME